MFPTRVPYDLQRHSSCHEARTVEVLRWFSHSPSHDPEVRYHPTERILFVSLSRQSLESTRRSRNLDVDTPTSNRSRGDAQSKFEHSQDSPRTSYSTIPRPTCCSSLVYIDSYANVPCPKTKIDPLSLPQPEWVFQTRSEDVTCLSTQRIFTSLGRLCGIHLIPPPQAQHMEDAVKVDVSACVWQSYASQHI